MPPGRKKGANRAKSKNPLSLGDLVLAKVKGFPAWPAKISRPEDWDRSPDPKKYFVQFFGTAEIAFVAPADIQAFTNEAKNKLSARCQGKTVKDFARAVKEICEAFEELQQKSSGDSGEEIDRTTLGCLPSSNDGGNDSKHAQHHNVSPKDEAEMLEPGVSVDKEGRNDEIHGLERCSWNHRDNISVTIHNIEPDSSQVSSDKKGIKMEDGPQSPYEGILSNTEPVSGSYLLKRETSLSTNPGTVGGELSSKLMNTEGHSKEFKTSITIGTPACEENSPTGLVDNENKGSPPLAVSLRTKSSGGGQKVIANGLEAGKASSQSKGDSSVERHKKPRAILKTPKHEVPESREHLNDELMVKTVQEKIAMGGGTRQVSPYASKSNADAKISNKAKILAKANKQLAGANDSHGGHFHKKEMLENSTEEDNVEGFSYVDYRKRRNQLGSRKDKTGTIGDAHPAKRSRHVTGGDDKGERSNSTSRKSDSTSSAVVGIKVDKLLETKKSTSLVKAENHLAQRNEIGSIESNLPGDEAVLPLTKRRRRALEAMSACVSKATGNMTEKSSDLPKNDKSNSDSNRSPVTKARSKRRSFYPFDDEDDEAECKTPIHRGSASILKIVSSGVQDSVQTNDINQESPSHARLNIKDVTVRNISADGVDDRPLKDKTSPVKTVRESSSPSLKQIEDKKPKKAIDLHVPSSPGKQASDRLSSKEGKPTILSPKDPVGLVDRTKQVEHKIIGAHVKASVTTTGKKVITGPSKGSGVASDSLNRVMTQKNKLTLVSEKLKATPKTTVRMNINSDNRSDVTGAADHSNEKDILLGDRFDVAKDDKISSFLIESNFTDSSTSMKHLIAAAQAKRRQAYSQFLPHENATPAFISTPYGVQGRSPSPASGVQPVLSGIVMQQDTKGFYDNPSGGSPSAHVRQIVANNQIVPEEYESRVSPGYRAHGGSLSGGTEAAVARDAFEGMIETLSRTKESIGRATRLAIDCAKYGIASEVVELLIQKLENEPSFHRRVDLFFLVDSITQCSHSQKGIAEASYIPTVQAALPRLLGAAAPPGAGACENRRQCHKVLRLWLERKILPESFLRRYMDDIGVSNDDMNAGFFLRRPSRAERAVDDPIREMEGMLVDEYGSNATFQLPGFLSSHAFEDEEEDLPNNICKDNSNESPIGASNTSEEPETCPVTPNDRRHRILEEVDGELEMEDVSASSKDERPVAGNSSYELESQQQSDRNPEATSNNLCELPPLPLGSPPLPLDSPPPPPPPPFPPSPPPPPPPLSPPPPPPPLPSLPPPPSVPPPPSFPPPSVSASKSPSFVCHPSASQEYCRTQSANQHLQISGDAPLHGQVNAPVKSEMVPQQSPCFVTRGVCQTQDVSYGSSRSFEPGHSDMYLRPQVSHPNQQFQTAGPSFQQRPYHHIPPAQPPPSHFPYARPTVQQHSQQAYHPYSSQSLPNGRRQYATDDHWRASPDNRHGVWMAGGRTPSAPFVQEGFFCSPAERPFPNPRGFQHPAHNPHASGVPIPGHGVGQMLPCRPDMSALNCWRPA